MKHHIQRDGLSMHITADSREEAAACFAERLEQKRSERRSTQQIQAEAMTPEALAVKRTTAGILLK